MALLDALRGFSRSLFDAGAAPATGAATGGASPSTGGVDTGGSVFTPSVTNPVNLNGSGTAPAPAPAAAGTDGTVWTPGSQISMANLRSAMEQSDTDQALEFYRGFMESQLAYPQDGEDLPFIRPQDLGAEMQKALERLGDDPSKQQLLEAWDEAVVVSMKIHPQALAERFRDSMKFSRGEQERRDERNADYKKDSAA